MGGHMSDIRFRKTSTAIYNKNSELDSLDTFRVSQKMLFHEHQSKNKETVLPN